MKPDTKKAADKIIAMQTLPPQIDYISPSEKAAEEKAQEYIDALPETEKVEAESYIAEQIDSYYTPDETGHSPADLDAMF